MTATPPSKPAEDARHANCRFRLQEEGKPYPRSRCAACGKGIASGLGTRCAVSSFPASAQGTVAWQALPQHFWTRPGASIRLKRGPRGGTYRVTFDDGRTFNASSLEEGMEYADDRIARLAAAPEPAASPPSPGEVRGIYIASKTTHGARWRELRASGVPIISTWIDEAEAGATSNWPDLWHRCVREASRAAVTIVYREQGEVLKGAFVEMGAALAAGRIVFAVGCDEFSVRNHMRVVPCASLEEALDLARIRSALASDATANSKAGDEDVRGALAKAVAALEEIEGHPESMSTKTRSYAVGWAFWNVQGIARQALAGIRARTLATPETEQE